MVDGFPYKEEVGGSNPSVPTTDRFEISDLKFEIATIEGFENLEFYPES